MDEISEKGNTKEIHIPRSQSFPLSMVSLCTSRPPEVLYASGMIGSFQDSHSTAHWGSLHCQPYLQLPHMVLLSIQHEHIAIQDITAQFMTKVALMGQ